MNLTSAWANLSAASDRFRQSESGGLSAALVLATTLLIVALGATIDFARYVSARTSLQAALDGAALQGATSALEEPQLITLMERSFAQNFDKDHYGNAVFAGSITSDDTILASAQFEFQTDFIRIGGKRSFSVLLKAEATRAPPTHKDIEVAIALDASNVATPLELVYLWDAASVFNTAILDDTTTTGGKRLALIPYRSTVYLKNNAAGARGTPLSGTCSAPGCTSFTFNWYNPSIAGTSGSKTYKITNCVTDRSGSEALTEGPVAANPVNPLYDANFYTNCSKAPGGSIKNEIVGLTSDKDEISNTINTIYPMAGGTGRAMQIGTAWAWYALSPLFGYFTGNYAPVDYTSETLKVAIITASGDSDIGYCNGVVSKDSEAAGLTSTHTINCSPTNGDPDSQTKALCENMKAKGITIYTVGIGVSSNAVAQDVLSSCATSAAHYTEIDSSETLSTTFESLAAAILAASAAGTGNSPRLLH